MTSRRARILRGLLTAAAIAAVVVAFVTTWHEAGEVALPSFARLLASTVPIAGAGLLASVAWTVLLDRRWPVLAPGFLVAQLAKYIPGSIWQGVGQVLDVERHGVGRGAASVTFLAQLGTQAAGAALVGLGVVVVDPPATLLATALLLPIGALLLRRPWLAAFLRLGARLWERRLGGLPDALPSQPRLLAAAGVGVGTIALLGIGFVLLLPGLTNPRTSLGVLGAFALAWLVGFLVIPLPAGVGVREFVLVITLAPFVAPPTVIAATVAHRLVQIAVEAGLAGVSHLVRIGLGRATAERPHAGSLQPPAEGADGTDGDG